MITAHNTATEKQLQFIADLVARKQVPARWVSRISGLLSTEQMDIAKASQVIDALLDLPDLPKPPATFTPDEGFYEFTSGPYAGRVAKVLTSHYGMGAGRRYVKVLDFADGHWAKITGGLRMVKEYATALTAERAAQLGQVYGVCCRCGRTLTDEESIARGIGPVCANKGF